MRGSSLPSSWSGSSSFCRGAHRPAQKAIAGGALAKAPDEVIRPPTEGHSGAILKGDELPFLLEIRNVSRHFGGLVALNDVSFGVQRGEIVGLIGPNGAGNSTLFNVITGFFPPSRGRILFKGADIGGLKPHQIARLGIVRTFQLTVLFGQFSVLENVLLGSHLRSRMLRPLFSRRAIPPAEWNRAEEILSFTDLAHLRDQRAADLPHGHQRMLAVAVALGAEARASSAG